MAVSSMVTALQMGRAQAETSSALAHLARGWSDCVIDDHLWFDVLLLQISIVLEYMDCGSLADLTKRVRAFFPASHSKLTGMHPSALPKVTDNDCKAQRLPQSCS